MSAANVVATVARSRSRDAGDARADEVPAPLDRYRGHHVEMNRRQRRRRIERARHASVSGGHDSATVPLCIVCLSSKNPFTGSEHVLSEALGNTSLVLPPGVVCDRCNNGVLARLDAALLAFPISQLMRVMYGLPSKSGNYPTANFSNGKLISLGPGQLVMRGTSARFVETVDDNSLRLNLQLANLTGRKIEWISRALLKMALECAYIDHGRATLLDSSWDDVRHAVVTGGHRGYLVIPNK